jgi:hypothetical protein
MVAGDDLLTERLLRVIDEGRRTATYKLALLLALIDAVAESPGEHTVPTRRIAEHVVAIYYPQTRVRLERRDRARAPPDHDEGVATAAGGAPVAAPRRRRPVPFGG